MRHMFGPMYEHFRERPVFYRAEAGSAMPCTDYQMRGITSGTRIATTIGWRAVETLAVGDSLLTFDNGPQKITAITRATQFVHDHIAPDFANPIHVPAGAIGNAEPMVVLPEQNVMIESDEAEARTGDPFALIPAKALVGYRGVDRFRALRAFEVLTLHFENDELVYVEGGALFLAPSTVPGDIAALDEIGRSGQPAPYVAYRGQDAAELVAALTASDTAEKANETGLPLPLRAAA